MKSSLFFALILLAASASHSQTSPAASEAERPASVAAKAAAAPAPAPERKPDVIFVPTPQAVVDEMQATRVLRSWDGVRRSSQDYNDDGAVDLGHARAEAGGAGAEPH